MKVLLLDIEGTVCPITFVKEGLFPYFLEKLPLYLDQESFPIAHEGTGVTGILAQLPEEIRSSKDKTHNYFTDLVKRDVKDPVLKSLQGYIWKQGYESGELKAPVYTDAVNYIENNKDVKLYIYSSGSVKAQILLFQYVLDPRDESRSINLNPHLSGYFDITTSGYKYEQLSYEKILKSIGVEGADVLFLSDNVAEVKAAIAAGMNSYIVERPGNAPLTEEDRKLKVIKSLDEI